MPVVSIGPNLVALKTTNKINQTQDSLKASYERLSSGLRINKPSDDPAGLSVSVKLRADTRIYGQALRNVNDGVSLLATAEGATEELSNIIARLKELATQSANGVLSTSQRRAIDTEGAALTDEFNRIVGGTDFNGLKVINGNFGNLQVQSGYGNQGFLNFGVGTELDRSVGNGTFGSINTSFTVGTNAYGLALADVNGDGYVDMLNVNLTDDKVSVFLSNGNGTFAARVTYGVGGNQNPVDLQLADVNGDGILDIVTSNASVDVGAVLLGNSNGTFNAPTSFAFGDFPDELALVDMNRDGKLDIVSVSSIDQKLSVLLGNGDGTFKAKISSASPATSNNLAVQDFNQDGIPDVALNRPDDGVNIYIGNGDGTFLAFISYYAGDYTYSVRAADLNYDGIVDIVTSSATDVKINVLIGNGDGSFKANVSYASLVGGTPKVTLADINGDGVIDVVNATGNTSVGVLLGNSNGTFKAVQSYTLSQNAYEAEAADFNGDGAVELAVSISTSNAVYVLSPNTSQTTTIQRLNLTTQADARAALNTLEQAASRVYLELASLGSAQRRLGIDLERVGQLRESLSAANSRITDIDTAHEVAKLVKNQVLSQAQTALLAQANQTPSIILGLL